MTFNLSTRSLKKLEGVHPTLVETVKKAISLTKIDFGVIYGVRTFEEQKKLFDSKRSQTMRSKHLLQDDYYAHSVDLMAYQDGEPCWEIQVYDDIADAMKDASKETGAVIRWGASWTVPDIAKFDGTMEEAMLSYVDARRSENRRPFIDGPHFELN